MVMIELSKLTTTYTNVMQFLKSVAKQQEEQRSFQLLDGIDNEFGAQRSQILLLLPLPNVDAVYGMLQQSSLLQYG